MSVPGGDHMTGDLSTSKIDNAMRGPAALEKNLSKKKTPTCEILKRTQEKAEKQNIENLFCKGIINY